MILVYKILDTLSNKIFIYLKQFLTLSIAMIQNFLFRMKKIRPVKSYAMIACTNSWDVPFVIFMLKVKYQNWYSIYELYLSVIYEYSLRSLSFLFYLGMSMFCFKCSHGGHYHHLKKWFESNKCCALGCGCCCENYQFVNTDE